MTKAERRNELKDYIGYVTRNMVWTVTHAKDRQKEKEYSNKWMIDFCKRSLDEEFNKGYGALQYALFNAKDIDQEMFDELYEQMRSMKNILEDDVYENVLEIKGIERPVPYQKGTGQNKERRERQ